MDLLPYADDTVWLMFGLGLTMTVGAAVAHMVFSANGWASLGFALTGLLVSVSYYVIGTHPPIAGKGPKTKSGAR